MELLEKILLEDKTYQKDMKDARDLEKRYESLDLTQEQRIFIGDYIACLETASYRKCEVALKFGRFLGELDKDFCFE